jgi:hypothetical protein
MTTKQATECAGTCKRMLRPRGESAESWPNTVIRHGRGMCWACNQLTPREVLPPIRPCQQCGTLTRPKIMPETAAPNTRAREGELCRPCSAAGQHVTPERARYVANEIIAYLRSRGRHIEPKLSKEAAS